MGMHSNAVTASLVGHAIRKESLFKLSVGFVEKSVVILHIRCRASCGIRAVKKAGKIHNKFHASLCEVCPLFKWCFQNAVNSLHQ